ncbi:MAG: DUF4837 family protein [Bacteroidales bacterium]|jgi:hypothetical protein|nr:DUF4837 family protein [Bacteroidales bacterium]
MKRQVIYFVLIFAGILFHSCGKKSPGLKNDHLAVGKAGEVILIMDKNVWSEQAVQQVKEILLQPQVALPQQEPMFDIIYLENKAFTSNFQKHRNIVRFEIGDNISANAFSIDKNIWASHQLWINIKGNDPEKCLNFFIENQKEIIKELYHNDLVRIQTLYRSETDPTIDKLIRSKFGISLIIPRQYYIASDQPDFLWLRYRTNKNDRFVIIYKSPVQEELNSKLLADFRDTITKKYIPGTVVGAYPIITRDWGLPIVKPFQIGNKEGFEMRGLWESVRDKMGGPLYSFTFKDQSGLSYITVDGFVYAPQESKRDFLREVEAIVKSLR